MFHYFGEQKRLFEGHPKKVSGRLICGSQCSGLINSLLTVHLSGKWIVTHSDQALPAVLPEALIALHMKLFISTSRGLRPHLGSNYKAARGTGVCHGSQAVIYRFCLSLESELSPHLFPSSCASWLKAFVSCNSLLYYLCRIYRAPVKNQILWVSSKHCSYCFTPEGCFNSFLSISFLERNRY